MNENSTFFTQEKFSKAVINTISTGVMGAFCFLAWNYVASNRADISALEEDNKELHSQMNASVSAFKDEIAKLGVEMSLKDDSLRRAWSAITKLQTEGAYIYSPTPQSVPEPSPVPASPMPAQPTNQLKQYEDSKSKIDWTIEQKKRAN